MGKSNLLARVVTSNGGNLGLGQADEAGETGFWHICRCCDTIDKQRLTKNLKLQKGEVLEKLFLGWSFPGIWHWNSVKRPERRFSHLGAM